MSPTRSRLLLAAVAALATLVPDLVSPLPPVATARAQSLDDFDEIVEEREATESDFGKAVDAYDELLDTIDAAEGEYAHLQDRAAELEAEAARLTGSLADRARLQFMRGGQPVFMVLASEDPGAAVQRAGLLAALNRREQGQLEAAVNVREQLDQTRVLLADRRAELDAMAQDLEARRDALERELGRLKLIESDLRDRKARQIELRNGVINGIYACIVDPNRTHFRDTWGAPRGGGTRTHKGTDVFAPYGDPVYAITNGVVSRLNSSSIGGISVYLDGDDGNLYYYTHLSGYVDGLYAGKRVEAGEHIAFNGATGNARGGAPHVHFQFHPGGGGPVNPYEMLATICWG